jgi:hypothetical protein
MRRPFILPSPWRLGASPDLIGSRPTPWAGWALLLLAGGLALWQGLAWRELSDRVAAERQSLAKLLPVSTVNTTAMTPEERQRHAAMESLAAYLATPWEELLGVFERHRSSGVILRRLEPDAATGVVRLTGEATDLAAMVAYLTELERQPGLAQVTLAHHDRLKDSAGIEFSINAAWSGVQSPRPGNAASAEASGGVGR